MAVVRPFRALRPDSKLVAKVAALPYDVMSSDEARVMVKDNLTSFLRIDRAEVNFPEPIDVHHPSVYSKAREILLQMIADKVYQQDENDCFYIYQQIMDGRKQTGLVCSTSIDDYLNDIIKKHEHTRPDKEQDRIDHIDTTQAHTGPIFQTYKTQPVIEEIIRVWTTQHTPIYDFMAEDGVSHICWVINCEDTIKQLVASFEQVENLYIADGHHRSAAALKVGLKRRESNKQWSGREEYNYFLSVLFPETELKILPYNRVVSDLAGLSDDQFLQRVRENFVVEIAPNQPYQPDEKQTYGMFLAGMWYKLTPKPEACSPSDPVKQLDVAILQDCLLHPILNILDPRTDQRIQFVGGIRGTKELEHRVNQDMKVAFSLYPTAITEVMDVADANKVMPPKSTWFEPKLRSGIFIHLLD